MATEWNSQFSGVATSPAIGATSTTQPRRSNHKVTLTSRYVTFIDD
ncbi:MAG TPA: hypothetical protein V6D11_16755 [Waterburya sp.]